MIFRRKDKCDQHSFVFIALISKDKENLLVIITRNMADEVKRFVMTISIVQFYFILGT